MNKSLLLVFAALMMLCGCGKQDNPQWEYMVLPIEGSKLPTVYAPNDKEVLIQESNFKALQFYDPVAMGKTLSSYGKEGWELVDVYTTTETVFPNFGEAEYHTGVKSNTRTNTVNFVFKRRIKSDETVQSK